MVDGRDKIKWIGCDALRVTLFLHREAPRVLLKPRRGKELLGPGSHQVCILEGAQPWAAWPCLVGAPLAEGAAAWAARACPLAGGLPRWLQPAVPGMLLAARTQQTSQERGTPTRQHAQAALHAMLATQHGRGLGLPELQRLP